MDNWNIAEMRVERHNKLVFATEKDAEKYIKQYLHMYGIAYAQQHKIKGARMRLDFVLKVDGYYFALEVKRDLHSMKEIGHAAAQANSYAKQIKQPVFIGPILDDDRGELTDRIVILLGRFNVGALIIRPKQNRMCFRLSDRTILNLGQTYWDRNKVDPRYYAYKTAQGSKSKVKQITGEQDG